MAGNKKKAILPWNVRFKAAVMVAEALNYLHNECSPPVIHRDVKSSNILLSHKFQAQVLFTKKNSFLPPTDKLFYITNKMKN